MGRLIQKLSREHFLQLFLLDGAKKKERMAPTVFGLAL